VIVTLPSDAMVVLVGPSGSGKSTFAARHFAPSEVLSSDALRAVMSLHVITAAAIFLGASNAAREITKEAAIYARERLVNLDIFPYVMSKVLVLSLLCFFQAAILVGIFATRMDLPGSDWSLFLTLLAAIFELSSILV